MEILNTLRTESNCYRFNYYFPKNYDLNQISLMFSRHEKLSEVDTQRANPTTIPNLKSNRSMIQKLPTIKVCRAESCINNKAK